jgi:hypothetical protein
MTDFLNMSSFTGVVTAEEVSGGSSISPQSNLMNETRDITNLLRTIKLKFTAQQCHGKM